jgi:hypothetical protein
MDQNTRAFIAGLLAENERLERLVGLGFGIAACMQQLADAAGAGFGVPSLTATLPLAAVEQIARDLAARVDPPEPAPASNGQRVPVGAGAQRAYSTAEQEAIQAGGGNATAGA